MNDIPIHFSSLPPIFAALVTSALPFPMVLRSRSLPLQQASICLEMSLCCSTFYGNEQIRWVGGREETPVLREALPLSWARAGWEVGGLLETGWCSSSRSKQPCSSYIYLFSSLCVYQERARNQSSWKETFVLCLQYLMQWKPNQRNCEYLVNNHCFVGN